MEKLSWDQKRMNTKAKIKKDSITLDQWLDAEEEDKAERVIISKEMLRELADAIDKGDDR